MGARGRLAEADAAIPEHEASYLEPPKEMPAGQQKIWWEVVRSKPPIWFTQENAPLLEAYCQAVESFRELRRRMERQTPTKISDYRFLQQMINAQVLLMVSLATRMRITQQSKLGPKIAARMNRDHNEDEPWNE